MYFGNHPDLEMRVLTMLQEYNFRCLPDADSDVMICLYFPAAVASGTSIKAPDVTS